MNQLENMMSKLNREMWMVTMIQKMMLMVQKKSQGSRKLGFASAMAASALCGVAHAQVLDLSDLPLNVQSDIPPNIIVSLDDSGSMAWGYMPDSAASRWWSTVYRSSTFNRVYYDPTVTYAPPSKSTGESEPDASFTAAIRGYYHDTVNQFTVDLSTSFRPIYYHYTTGGSIFLGNNAVASYGCRTTVCADEPAFYYEFHGSVAINAACDGLQVDERIIPNQPAQAVSLQEDEGCYNKVVVTSAAEQTNFANWYQYYSVRADASKSALRLAFVPENVSRTARVGRQTLNNDRFIGSGTPSQDNPTIAAFDVAERAGFYDWVDSVPTSGGTPLRNAVNRAGEYFKTDNAYYTSPETSSGELLGCRANAHILVTDGFYNGGFTTPSSFLLDQAGTTLPDGASYAPATAPIFSNNLDSQSLADLTFHYWGTDLRTDFANNVRPYSPNNDYFNPADDPADWQHMTSFAVAFGAEGTVSTDAATYQNLLAGTQLWPQTVSGQSTTIDDLYHSGVNGRGGFFSATSPDQLVNALVAIAERFEEGSGFAESIGAASGRVSGGDNVYLASFDTDSWSGDLEAFQISDGSDFGVVGASGCNTKPLGTLCGTTPVWSAASRNDESDPHVQPSARTIFTYDPTITDVDARGILFEWSSSATPLNVDQQAFLNQSDNLGQDRLNYLRGDDSNELDKNGGVFRTRTAIENKDVSRVGAIVHSNPTYVGSAGIDANGNTLLPFRFPDDLENSDYQISSRTPMVYVGANDGMLHAYDASAGSTGGDELFAYVPNEVIEHLHELTEPDFGFGAYVDGLMDMQDAYIDGSWRTLIAGGLRTGGQGFYMLDVTNPDSVSDPNNVVMWEFTDDNDADMGYTFGQPVIVKSNYNDGEWVVLLPNGYNSNEPDGSVGSGDAILYVLAADDGEVLAKIDVGENNTPNGLSSAVAVSDFDVQVFDNKATGTDPDVWTADYAYAGDLHGNLWKFDLSSTNPGDWDVVLMFNAGSNQAITAKPAVGSFPVRGSDANNQEYRFVYFGTGKYVEPSDVSTTSQQAFYGIIDKDTCTSGNSACILNSDLTTQTISASGLLTSNAIPSTGKGCKLDLDAGGSSERMLNQPAVIAGNVVFGALTPNGDVCEAGATGALYALNRFTCGATANSVLDVNNDNEINSLDKISGQVVSRKIIDPGLVQVFSGSKDQLAIISPSSTEQLVSGDRKGRVRWRQIK